ncbi:hypothetical protein SDC9_138282 [bioreactor metagenome]|jgi:hypothetical protein|uniref:Uncharacterized protein n=1 Tax=bioreactor metagenome TaxID=1076179 RepID=A0A645DPD2_9ZZZZ
MINWNFLIKPLLDEGLLVKIDYDKLNCLKCNLGGSNYE